MKKLKVVLIVLIVILLSLISFGGVYYKSKNEMSNYIPAYTQGTDLKGYRQAKLVVEDTTSDSEETSEENKQENNYSADDYNKSAQVIRGRLKSLKVENYSVTVDENTGMINITLPENNQTDIILADITQIGKFSIKDSNTKEDLLTNSDVARVEIGKRDTGSISQTYMDVHFNTSGSKKFKNVTKEYQNRVEENTSTENSTENNEVDNEANNETNVENNTENTENQEEENTSEEEKTGKEVELDIDGNTMMTTNFTEIIDNGVLSLTLGASTLADEDINALYSAYNLGAIIENEPMPVSYTIESNTFIASVMDKSQIKAVICIEIGLGLILLLVLVVKYRAKGVVASILSVGFIAILLIVIRYANVSVSLQGLFAIAVASIINYALSIKCIEYLNKEDLIPSEKKLEFRKLIKQCTIIVMPELIVSIVCCLTQWEQLLSFGMVIFWGIIISWIYNIIVAKFLED